MHRAYSKQSRSERISKNSRSKSDAFQVNEQMNEIALQFKYPILPTCSDKLKNIIVG